MKRNTTRTVLTLVLTLLITITYAQTGPDGREDVSKAIKTSVPFLTIAPDSRAGSMGDAGVATSPDINSQNWNASKFPFIEEKAGLAISYTPWLRKLGVTDLNLLYLAGYYKLDDIQVVSGGLRYFNLGSITEISEDNTPTGNIIRPNEFAIDAGYSRKFGERFGGGLVFRFIYSDIANGVSNLTVGAESKAGTSFAADISGYYQQPITIAGLNSEMAYGMNISNLGAKIKYSESKETQFIPTNLKLGGRLSTEIDEYNKVSFTMDINKLLIPSPQLGDTIPNEIGVVEGLFKSFGDAEDGFSEEFHELMWSFGLEYVYMNQFAVRAGYFNEHKTKGARKYATVGVGFFLNVFSLDFSYLIPTTPGGESPLARTMRFTLGFRFD